MAKAKNIYPCFKCGQWFPNKGAQKAHTCGEPVKEEKQEEIKESTEVDSKESTVVESNESTETVKEEKTENEEVSSEEENVSEFDRKEAVKALKEAGIISDGRSVTNKSDEELIEMLKEIKA